MATVTLSSTPPELPRADFAFEIDFRKGAGPASRVFAATHDFIRACEALDRALVQSIDSNIQPFLVLEDIQQGSIKTFLRSTLGAIDDTALRDLDWKKQVGDYLVRAKYAVLRWADSEDRNQNLPDLREEIRQQAEATNVRHLPDYAPPPVPDLIEAVRNFESVKERLVEGDRARFISGLPDAGSWELNLSIRIRYEDLSELAVARSTKAPASEMILPVKRPDYLSESMWQLRHGNRSISARIDDEEWLKRFLRREIDLRPGDALRCLLSVEHRYGHDNELLSERFRVVEVLEVLPRSDQPPELDLIPEQRPPATIAAPGQELTPPPAPSSAGLIWEFWEG